MQQWETRCPVRFRDASLADLVDEPGLADGRVAGWLESGHRGLVLHSERTGNGKTLSLYSVGWQAIRVDQWVVIYTAAELATALQPGDDAAEVEQTLRRCDLLGIDDLGREKQSEWRGEQWQSLLDYRWREGKRTMVSTNLTGEQFVDRYGTPIVDRIIDDAVVVKFTANGQRKAVPW